MKRFARKYQNPCGIWRQIFNFTTVTKEANFRKCHILVMWFYHDTLHRKLRCRNSNSRPSTRCNHWAIISLFAVSKLEIIIHIFVLQYTIDVKPITMKIRICIFLYRSFLRYLVLIGCVMDQLLNTGMSRTTSTGPAIAL